MAGRKNTGKPRVWTRKRQDAVFPLICDRIAAGESLTKICKDPGMPTRQEFRTWLIERPDLKALELAAREDQADFYADQIVEIADRQRLTPEARRVMIDARKWTASKLKPKTYGDRMQVGGVPGNPIELGGKVVVELVRAPAAP